MSEGPPPRSVSLSALLAAALFAELWLNRIVARLLHGDALRRFGTTARVVDVVALFLFEFTSVLGTTLLAVALVDLARSPAYRRPLRAALAVTGGVATVLCVIGVFTRMSARLHAQLYLSAIFALLIIAIGTLALPASKRLRAGIVLFIAPLGCMLVASLLQRMSPTGVLNPNASLLVEISGAALVMVGLLAPFLLGPRGPSGGLAVAMGAVVLGGGLTLGRLAWDSAAQLAAIGLAVAVPLHVVLFPMYVLGAAAMAYTIGGLVVRPGPERLRGIGLLLICTVGLQLELPYQIAGSLLGMLCLLESAARPALDAITREQFDATLRRWAGLLGSTHVTVTGPFQRERGRITFTGADGTAGLLCVDRYAGAIDRVELNVGEIGQRRAPFTVARRGRQSLGKQAEGALTSTEDREFDTHYLVYDRRGASARLLDAEMRARFVRLVDGYVGVWPQHGARFIGVALPPGDDGLPSLAQLLTDLRKRATA